MKKRKYLSSVLYLLFIFSISQGYAQVTVGSAVEPRKGALLDIKQENTTENEPNAAGGIGLPRVALVSPVILTIDEDIRKSNYVGITVYNITDNDDIKEGIYSWDGTRWKLCISVDDYGMEGQLLNSNGNGTFDWSNFVFPEYSFHKPTQISVFDSKKATDKSYSYTALTGGGDGTWGKKPKSDTFDDCFIYTETLDIQTAALKEKYLLLGIACVVEVATLGGFTPDKGFWQIMQIDVYIDDEIVQSNQRLYPTAAKSDKSIYIDMFSIVPLDRFDKGSRTLKIKLSNIENTFPDNVCSEIGCFSETTGKFYMITMTDLNLVLYEND